MLQEGEKSEKQFCTQRVARQMGKFVALVGLKIASLAFSVFFNIQILTTREAVFLCVEDNANLKIISPVFCKDKNTLEGYNMYISPSQSLYFFTVFFGPELSEYFTTILSKYGCFLQQFVCKFKQSFYISALFHAQFFIFKQRQNLSLK